MGYITELHEIYDELSELTDEDLVPDYADKLTTINETFNGDTSDDEFHLMNRCEDMLEVAKEHFKSIARQEEIDYHRDNRKHEGADELS